VVCAHGGDWRDEMQVKHDAKTIQEPRAATSKYRGVVQQSTAEYSRVQQSTAPSRTIYLLYSIVHRVLLQLISISSLPYYNMQSGIIKLTLLLLKAYDTIIQHNTTREQYCTYHTTPFPVILASWGCSLSHLPLAQVVTHE
jgi:hypothetical protein